MYLLGLLLRLALDLKAAVHERTTVNLVCRVGTGEMLRSRDLMHSWGE